MKNRLMGFDIDDILEFGGLRRQPSFVELALPALGLLAVGAAIGVAFGLMVAPSSGRNLRQVVSERIDRLREHRKSSEQQKQTSANGL
jgi:hypothetical protein